MYLIKTFQKLTNQLNTYEPFDTTQFYSRLIGPYEHESPNNNFITFIEMSGKKYFFKYALFVHNTTFPLVFFLQNIRVWNSIASKNNVNGVEKFSIRSNVVNASANLKNEISAKIKLSASRISHSSHTTRTHPNSENSSQRAPIMEVMGIPSAFPVFSLR